jgi:hypothetical protein
VSLLFSTDNVDSDDSGNKINSLEKLDLSWAAYHASLPSQVPSFISRSVLLTMFRDPAHSPAMICHAMTIVMSAVETVNPGQTPVLALDQPLYSLAKVIQWNWPEKFGEKRLVLMVCILKWQHLKL